MSEALEQELSFWDHLDELRKILFRILIVVLVVMVAAFLNKDLLFDIILAPQKSDFIIYRFFGYLSNLTGIADIRPETFHIEMINTQLTSQFMTHLSMSLYMSILISFPYILFQLFRFISPALYEHERKYGFSVISFSSLLFYIGVLFNYFVIFPLSFRFLATYQVSSEVQNMISLTSYTDTLMMLSLMMGIMSELPVLSWLLAKLGFLTDGFMKKYRKHAIVVILIIAAIITPTADAFTLFLVAMPIYLLYELSIVIVKNTVKRNDLE